MRKNWTELQLTIVYYVVKYGAHGAVQTASGFMSVEEIVAYLGHGEESFMYCHSKFRTILGYSPGEGRVAYLATAKQRGIVERYQNTTVSQLRLIISELSNELSLKSDSNILLETKDSLELTLDTFTNQLSFDF